MITNISVTPQVLQELAMETSLRSSIEAFPEDSQSDAESHINVWIRRMARDVEQATERSAIGGKCNAVERWQGGKEISSKRQLKYAKVAADYVAKLFALRGFETHAKFYNDNYSGIKFLDEIILIEVHW